jgi:hypothetical protein
VIYKVENKKYKQLVMRESFTSVWYFSGEKTVSKPYTAACLDPLQVGQVQAILT